MLLSKVYKIFKVILIFTSFFIYSSEKYTNKKALIFGISGQDGSYLTELLLEKGYEVHGLYRNRMKNKGNLVIENLKKKHSNLFLINGDIVNENQVHNIIKNIEPDEIYNFAAQSHVGNSFEIPGVTINSNCLGVFNILEGIKLAKLNNKTKFYQASSSEIFGNPKKSPQDESTSFKPCSPYAISKLCGYWATINYRDAYGIFACNGILFNHESPRRPDAFVTRKITSSAARIKCGLQDVLYLGNLDIKRDWGYAKDYVEAIWLILQQSNPDDYVIATGETHSIREFVEEAFKEVGIEILWNGSGVHEVGINKKTLKVVVAVDSKFFRPIESSSVVGNASKARNTLNWKPKTSFKDLIKLMVQSDLEDLEFGLKLDEK